MLIGILLTVQILVSVALVGVVLLQRSEGGGFVGGSGSAGGMSVRGASSVVDRMKIDNVDPSTLNRPQPAQPPAGTAQPGGPQSAPAPLQAPTPQINNPFLGQPAGPSAPPSK